MITVLADAAPEALDLMEAAGLPVILLAVAATLAGVVAFFFGHNSISGSRPGRLIESSLRITEPPAPSRPVRSAPASAVSDPREKRTSMRRGGHPVDILVTHGEAGGTPLSAVVMDRSRGGLGISASQPAEVGHILKVRAAHSDPNVWFQVEVRHCRPKEDKWFLGCKFEQKLSWGELLLFG